MFDMDFNMEKPKRRTFVLKWLRPPVARWHCQQLCQSRLLSGAAGDPGVPGLATGSGEWKQKSKLTGQTHSVPLVRSRQGSLCLGLLQQLGHQNPLKPKVCQLRDALWMCGESLTLTSATAVRTTLWPSWICPRATTSTSSPWMVTGCWIPTGWVEAGNANFLKKNPPAPMIMFSSARLSQRPRPGWLTTPSRWRGQTSKCLMRSGSTRRILPISQVVPSLKSYENYGNNANALASHCYISGGKPPTTVHDIGPSRLLRHYQTETYNANERLVTKTCSYLRSINRVYPPGLKLEHLKGSPPLV